MGCCVSVEDKRNQQIDEQLTHWSDELQREFKLLLLGTGESGKSTLVKQMKILFCNGYNDEELRKFKPVIFNNCVSSMRTLCAACLHLRIPVAPEHQELVQTFATDPALQNYLEPISPELASQIKALWADPGIKQCFFRAAEFQLLDCAQYYIESVDRLANPSYLPTQDDILRCRVKTTGIHELAFKEGNFTYRMVDVGGQRNERRKWLHCFQDVTAVLYVVALSEYDLRLYENDETNRMSESLKLFKEVSGLPWFRNSQIIVFLNKRDTFEEKISRVPLTVCFPEYRGRNTFAEAAEYIKNQFLNMDSSKKQIYTHMVCATDTKIVKQLFNDVKEIIISNTAPAGGGA